MSGCCTVRERAREASNNLSEQVELCTAFATASGQLMRVFQDVSDLYQNVPEILTASRE